MRFALIFLEYDTSASFKLIRFKQSYSHNVVCKMYMYSEVYVWILVVLYCLNETVLHKGFTFNEVVFEFGMSVIAVFFWNFKLR